MRWEALQPFQLLLINHQDCELQSLLMFTPIHKAARLGLLGLAKPPFMFLSVLP